MAKVMLIDATHPEETRVAVADGRKLEEFDVEIASRRPLKGNIYLAKVTRVEPSLQAAFVEYGGNRHGFLAFSEIHPDYYRIPVADRERLLRDAAADEDDEIDEADQRQQRGRQPRRTEVDTQPDSPSPTEIAVGIDRDHDHDHAGAGNDWPAQEQSSYDQPAYEQAEDPHADPVTATHDEPEYEDGHETASADGDNAEPMLSPWDDATGNQAPDAAPLATDEREPMPLETPRFELRGEPVEEPATNGESDASLTPEYSGERFGSEAGAPSSAEIAIENGNADLPAPAHAELVEVQTNPEVVDLAGGDEPAQQDDPELDEEQARRRRARNLRRYKIQEVIKRRQILLVQVTKEERGNKGAALTTYLSLAGRYCVLMPNTDRGGGISRRITSVNDRKRLKSIIDDLDAPDGMAVIVRTAGMERAKPEIKRDFEYLLRLWDEIRELTLKSSAPAQIYEEASLIKRSIRDLYTSDIGDIVISGDEAYRAGRAFMRTLAPSHLRRVQHYRDTAQPLFQRYQIESQIAGIHEPVVHLKSGGYIVINQTEALVAIDVNSGRATRERNIEETALRTNSEAAEEVARQLRLRDLAGLIVIDFIDMEENRNNAAVERRLKEALKNDRARIQIGRISSFGLLEMSRQRLHPSLVEASTESCPHCRGSGRMRSVESTALHVLRMVEEEIARTFSPGVTIFVPTSVALFILNHKRASIEEIEQRRGVRIYLQADDGLTPPEYRLDRIKQLNPGEEVVKRITAPLPPIEDEIDDIPPEELEAEMAEAESAEAVEEEAPAGGDRGDRGERGGRRRRRRRGRGGKFRADEFTESNGTDEAAENAQAAPRQEFSPRPESTPIAAQDAGEEIGDDGEDDDADGGPEGNEATAEGDQPRRRRRRGRRGGRRRSRRQEGGDQPHDQAQEATDGEQPRFGQPVPGLGDQPDLPDELPVQWAQRAAPVADVALDAAPQDAAGEEPQTKRRSRRPRRREEEPALETAALETVGAESAAAPAQVLERPQTEPAIAPPVQVIEVGREEAGADGDQQRKRGWWRRLIE
jgi:ribonuclease E